MDSSAASDSLRRRAQRSELFDIDGPSESRSCVHRSSLQRKDPWPCFRPRKDQAPRICYGLWRDERSPVHEFLNSRLRTPHGKLSKRLTALYLYGLAASRGIAFRWKGSLPGI